jgi:hypothetical protein
MTPRQYRLYLTGSQKLVLVLPAVMFLFIPLVFFILFSSGAFSQGSRPEEFPSFYPLFPFGVFFLFAAFYGWTLLSLPHSIIVGADKIIVFKSVLKMQKVRPTDVISIEPKSIRMNVGVSGYQLKHLNGKILYPGQFTGMYELLAEIKQVNPAIDIKGC